MARRQRVNLEHPAEHEARTGHRPLWRKLAVPWQVPVMLAGGNSDRPSSRELPPHFCVLCDHETKPKGLRLVDLEGELAGNDWFYIRAHLRKLAQSADDLEELYAEAATRGASPKSLGRTAWQFAMDMAHDYTAPDQYGLRDGAYVHEVLAALGMEHTPLPAKRGLCAGSLARYRYWDVLLGRGNPPKRYPLWPERMQTRPWTGEELSFYSRAVDAPDSSSESPTGLYDTGLDPRWHLEQAPREELPYVIGYCTVQTDDPEGWRDWWAAAYLPGVDLDKCAEHYLAEQQIDTGKAPWAPFPAGITRTEHKSLCAAISKALGRRPGPTREAVKLGPILHDRGRQHRLPDDDQAKLLHAAYVRYPWAGWDAVAAECGYGSADAARKAAQRLVETLNGRKHSFPSDRPEVVTDIASVLEYYGVDLPDDCPGRVSVQCHWCGRAGASVYFADGRKQQRDMYVCAHCRFWGTAMELWQWAEGEQSYSGTRKITSREAANTQITDDYNPSEFDDPEAFWSHEGF